jgi:hypothetical protein
MSPIAKALVVLIRGYRLLLSPWLGSHCRFTPSCSAYAIEALQIHGGGTGTYLAARRVLRCHPGCAGGLDPVPPAHPLDPSDSSHDRPRAGMAP